MKINPSDITSAIKRELSGYHPEPVVYEAGEVIHVGDGIARIKGLPSAKSGEMLEFENGEKGIALSLTEDSIGVILLSNTYTIHAGMTVRSTGSIPNTPVGDVLLGRVVNALGEPLDQKGAIYTNDKRPLEREAPGVMARDAVCCPLQTGIKAIDSMIPIGRGQRQLIIGDRQIGKTSIAIDTILNQRGGDVNCVYVAIGQKASTISSVARKLTDYQAMDYTTIVAATASDSPALQYIAPYTGCAIAEEWMEQGKDVLIIYDDLSKHAVSYRTLSLLLRRPPGREAYPGDVFYLHSRLLERAGKLHAKHGGGSMTALPIIETQAGNMSSYIATNVISITDGQIYLETESFNAGIRPAISPGLSVSRVGGAAQTKAMKKVSGQIRLLLAQYRELAKFAQFGSDLDKTSRAQLQHGARMVEILKQELYHPFTMEQQVISLLAATENLLDGIPIDDVLEFENSLLKFFEITHPDILENLRKNQDLPAELRAQILDVINGFKAEYLAE